MTSSTIYTSMAGLQALSTQMESTAANLANLQTPGYAALQTATEAAFYTGPNAPAGADPLIPGANRNTAQGAMQRTADPLNIALGGDAWLAVQSPGGTAITRNGSLQISAAGLLTDHAGNPVLGVNGQPVSLPSLTKIEIGTDGTISGVASSQPGATAQKYGQIKLAATPAGALTPVGNSLLMPPVGTVLAPSTNGSVHQGFLNASNTDPATTMMDMISGSRSYQLQTQILKAQTSSGQQLNSLMAQI